MAGANSLLAGTRAGSRGDADQNLLPVREEAGQIERGQVDTLGGAAGGGEGVDDPGASGEAHDARVAYLARDVNHDERRAGGRTGGRERGRWGRAGADPGGDDGYPRGGDRFGLGSPQVDQAPGDTAGEDQRQRAQSPRG